MNPTSRKKMWNAAVVLMLLGAALFVASNNAYAQVHGFRPEDFGHAGRGAGGLHDGFVGPHWGVQQYGHGYGGGHSGNGWVPAWGHGQFGYSQYNAGLHVWGPGYYSRSLHPYPLNVYPRGHRQGYYFSRYHRFPYYGGGTRYYHGHH